MKTLLVYYSRSGKTEAAVKKLAAELGGDAVRMTDGKSRTGPVGFLMAGLEAVSDKKARLLPVKLPSPLSTYDLVIVATPVWAGRVVPVVRTFLLAYGKEMKRTAWLITRAGTNSYDVLFETMDSLSGTRRVAGVSLQPGENQYDEKLRRFKSEVGSAGQA